MFSINDNDVVIVAARRTPIMKFTGSAQNQTAATLAAETVKAVLADTSTDINDIEELFLGSVVQAGQGQNPGRQAMLAAGASPEKGRAAVFNKVCGSGLYAVLSAVRAIKAGDIKIALAGGTESMSKIPHYLTSGRNGVKMGNQTLSDGMLTDGLLDFKSGQHMGNIAEMSAEKFQVSREAQDEFAVKSYQKTLAAMAAGKFDRELVKLEFTERRKQVVIEKDEIPAETTPEIAAAARPAFSKTGTVTAVNASKLADGAAIVLLMSRAEAKARNLKPLATIRGYDQTDVELNDALTSPMISIARLLEKTGLNKDQIDVYEINEAFSATSVAVNRQLDLDESRINIYGGSIALGHPIGASGARVLVTLCSALIQENKQLGIASLCIGGGEGISMLISRD